jgi:hypothetical protein
MSDADFNPQPDPPGGASTDFNPQPEPPGVSAPPGETDGALVPESPGEGEKGDGVVMEF